MSDSAPPVDNLVRPTLKQRVLNAGGWSIVAYAANFTICFGSNLLVTRLLKPEMFGVMAIATMVMIGLQMFSDLGVRQSVVQSKRGNDPLFLNTIWVIQIARGVFLWMFAVLVAFGVYLGNQLNWIPDGSAYSDPILPYVIAASALPTLIGAFEFTRMLEVSRRLTLGRATVIDISALIVSVVGMLAWVSIDRSIWVLVFGSFCSAVMRLIFSYTALPGTTNRFEWDKTAVHEIIHFGKWIFLSSVFGFLASSGDRLILGALISSTVLGLYAVAGFFTSTLEGILLKMIGEISYPALSEVVRERPADLKRVYYKFHIPIALFGYFCTGTLVTAGSWIVRVLYDHRYEEAGWMLQIAAIGLLTLPSRTAVLCFMSLGHPRILSEITAVRMVSQFGLVPLGFHFYGLSGAIWGFVLSQFSSVPLIIRYSLKYDLFDVGKELLLLPGILAGAAFGMVLATIGGMIIG